MKKLITMTIMVLAVAVAMAQAPEKFTYQAVVRNTSNALVTDAQVSVRVSILQGSASGNAVYVETHTATTNTNGLLTIEIGGGSNPQGTFVDIDWANGPFFLKTETDPNGGSNYTVTSTQQLLSVPYALYSKEAGNGFSGDYNDLTNRPQIPQSVSELANDANYITIDSVPTNVSAFNNDAGYITLEQVPAQVNADWNATEGAAEILNKPTIPTVPTDVSAFNNDVGYITGCVETDPQFNAWDKDYNDLINTPEIPTVPTDVSAFTNDAHYVSNAACEDVDLCALAAALAQLQALVEEQQQRIEELEAQIGTDTTTTPTDTTTVTNGTPCPGTPTVTDYDGNVYNTVLIGNQCWTKENLRVTHYSDGTPIPAGGNNTSNTVPYYYDYSSHSLPLETRGYLYNWPAAMVACPTGWHLPSDAEWTALTDYVGNQSEYICGGNSNYIAKALASTEGWVLHSGECVIGNDPETNNATGFSAVPAGSCFGMTFYIASTEVDFWTSTETSSSSVYDRNLTNHNADVLRYNDYKNNGRSIRCLRNEGGTDTTQTTLPTVITGAVSDITETTATCGGEVTADGGAAVTERGVCWSTSITPTIADAHTSDGTGTGTFTSSITGLNANTTYYVRAYATNSVGTGYGEVVTFTTEAATPAGDGQPCPGTPTVTDHEGNVYNTVQIGDQCWMRDNLRTTTSPSTGTYLIPAANTGYTYTGKQAFWYDNDSATYAPMNYGLLYNWNAAVDTFNTAYGETSVNTFLSNVLFVTFSGHRRGICPVGWHLPSDAEWTVLTNYVGSVPEYQCGGSSSYIAKALASETGWNSYSGACHPEDQSVTANNATGFSAVPAGSGISSSFSNAGNSAYFWSSTQYYGGSHPGRAYYRDLHHNNAGVGQSTNYKSNGYSVRCLRNEGGTDTTQTTLPTVITGAVSDITETTATCGGEVIADGGAAVTERGVCWSTSATPTVADAHTSDGTGTGTFTSSITGLNANTTYYVRAYATNSVGTGYGEVVTFTTEAATPAGDGQPCPGTPTVTDHEGNVYNTVQIGDQCWMRDNLRTTTSPSTGTYLIPAANTGYTYTGKQAFWYDNDSATYAPMNYGLLYNWNAAVDTFNTAYGETSVNILGINAVSVTFNGHRRGICPTGWHLPSDAEWSTMERTVSGTDWQTDYEASYVCRGSHAGKLAGGENWTTSTISGAPGDYSNADRNVFGFSAVPAGYGYGASFSYAGNYAYFWSSTQDYSSGAYIRYLHHNNAGVGRGSNTNAHGYSVRCLRDEGGTDTTQTTPGQPCPGAATVTDYDGNVYNTVLIGNQCWTKENLRVTHYSDGTTILAGGDNHSSTDPYYYDYSNSNIPLSERGYYYNWSAAMHGAASSNAIPSGVQGICPTGWHLPSDAEWNTMEATVSGSEWQTDYETSYVYRGSHAGKLAGGENWTTCTISGAPGDYGNADRNVFGFSAVPAGYGYGASLYYAGNYAYFWSSTQDNSSGVFIRYLHHNNAGVGRGSNSNSNGYSIRCLRDEGGTDTTQTTLPTVITGAVSDITETTATCGGEVIADGGAAVTERGVCWSTSATPTVADAHTTDGTGTGTFTSSITGLTANTTYYVRAYATNSVGTGYGEVVTFTTETVPPTGGGQPCPGTPTVTDYDGNVYNTVLIGNQCWTKENLRTTHYADGTSIPAGGDNSSTTAPYYYDYSSSNIPLSERGYLYNWPAAMHGAASSNAVPSGVQGVCPTGWHLPSDAEWNTMEATVSGSDWQTSYETDVSRGSHAGKLAGGDSWATSTISGAPGDYGNADRNVSGFSAVPAGVCDGSSFDDTGNSANFWSARRNGGRGAYHRTLYYNGADVIRLTYSHYSMLGYGFSVRCVRNEGGTDTTQTTLPTVITGAVSDITENTATCGGEVTADGSAAVTERGVCWSISATPTIADAHTSDGTGTGTFTSSITGLTASTTYYVRAYATNSVGTGYGEVVTFTTEVATPAGNGQPCPGTPTVTDHEGNIYNTVQIGDQCWTRENMRCTTSPSTGTYLIPIASFLQTYTYTGKQARWYNNDSAMYAPQNYGLLYNWNAAVDTFNTAYEETSVNTNSSNAVSVTFNGHRRGICPMGWHLPSDVEWNTMEATVSGSNWQTSYETTNGFRGSHAGKLAGGDIWTTSSSITSGAPGDYSNVERNISGFSAVPAGCHDVSLHYAGYHAYFWSATQDASSPIWAYYRVLCNNNADVRREYGPTVYGFSVRCLRNSDGGGGTSVTLPTVTTDMVSVITASTAICDGNVISDGGATVTVRGVCWSTYQYPTVGNNHTTEGSGMGIFNSSITGLTANTTYYVRAYATNSVGTGYGEVVMFTTEAATPAGNGQPCPGATTVTDYDGNVYNTVQIGDQCWMRENMRVTHYSDGTPIPDGGDNLSYTAPYYYDNSSSGIPLSERCHQYNWPAAMHGAASSGVVPSGVQGVCPTGWHLPSDAEWTILTDYVKSQAEYTCGGNTNYIAKALASTTGWYIPTNINDCAPNNDQGINNASGFGAVPAGSCSGSSFVSEGYYAYFWSSTQENSQVAYNRSLCCDRADVYRGSYNKRIGIPVRCLRD